MANAIEEPTYESHEYHPTRVDGGDRNLRKINKADWDNGARCICKACCEAYESSRLHRTLARRSSGREIGDETEFRVKPL